MNFTFTEQELQLLYAACMAYGNQLSDMGKQVPDETEITDLLSEKAKESWDLAKKITQFMQ